MLGFVGDTGDARGTPPHLHFEIHPAALLGLGYDGVINPYEYLLELAERQDWRSASPERRGRRRAGAGAGAVLLDVAGHLDRERARPGPARASARAAAVRRRRRAARAGRRARARRRPRPGFSYERPSAIVPTSTAVAPPSTGEHGAGHERGVLAGEEEADGRDLLRHAASAGAAARALASA